MMSSRWPVCILPASLSAAGWLNKACGWLNSREPTFDKRSAGTSGTYATFDRLACSGVFKRTCTHMTNGLMAQHACCQASVMMSLTTCARPCAGLYMSCNTNDEKEENTTYNSRIQTLDRSRAVLNGSDKELRVAHPTLEVFPRRLP
jgi:hypothetical protein